MSRRDYIQRGIEPGSVKAEIGTRAWEELARYSEAYPPQSITVEIKYGDYTYHGTAYLIEQGEGAAQPASVVPPQPEQPPSQAQAEGGQQ